MSFFDKGILLQEGSNLSMNYKMAETNGKTGHIDHAFYDKNKPTVYFWWSLSSISSISSMHSAIKDKKVQKLASLNCKVMSFLDYQTVSTNMY